MRENSNDAPLFTPDLQRGVGVGVSRAGSHGSLCLLLLQVSGYSDTPLMSRPPKQEGSILIRAPTSWQMRRLLRRYDAYQVTDRTVVNDFSDATLVVGCGASFSARNERRLLKDIALYWGRKRAPGFAWLAMQDTMGTSVYWFEDLSPSSGQRAWFRAVVERKRDDVSWHPCKRPYWDAGTLAIFTQEVEFTGSSEMALVIESRGKSREGDSGLGSILEIE